MLWVFDRRALLTSAHNICFRREIRNYISYNLDSLLSYSYEVLVPEKYNFLISYLSAGKLNKSSGK